MPADEYRHRYPVVQAYQWFPGVSTIPGMRVIESDDGYAFVEATWSTYGRLTAYLDPGMWIVREGTGACSVWSDQLFREAFEATE
jgi:hypothetical protein